MRTGDNKRGGDTKRAKYIRGGRRYVWPDTTKAPPVGYSQLRRRWLDQLSGAFDNLPAANGPLWFAFGWHEPDRRRDKDGVRSGGVKLILDALVLAHVMPDDGNDCVGGFLGDAFYYGAATGVSIDAYDGDRERVWQKQIGYRLPDANEIIAAARVDGILTERTRRAREARR